MRSPLAFCGSLGLRSFATKLLIDSTTWAAKTGESRRGYAMIYRDDYQTIVNYGGFEVMYIEISTESIVLDGKLQ